MPKCGSNAALAVFGVTQGKEFLEIEPLTPTWTKHFRQMPLT